MKFQAVIAKDKPKRIKEISRTGIVYATDVDSDNRSRVIGFYKNEEAARKSYPKPINAILHVVIDTDTIRFYGENNELVSDKPEFAETEFEYIFSFAEDIKDLHCNNIELNGSVVEHIPVTQAISKSPLPDGLIESKMQELAKLIGYEPNDITHIMNAMQCEKIHNHTDGKNRDNHTNGSLATLGDSILKFVLTEYLYDKGYDKGKITDKRQTLEKNETLFDLCHDIGIYKYAYNDLCFYDDAPAHNQVSHNKHDCYVEAIVAAIYKDRGFDYCKKWVIAFLRNNGILND